MIEYNDNLKIAVCDNCGRACCWYGEFMCDGADIAGLLWKTIGQLRKEALESPDYWSRAELLKQYGRLPVAPAEAPV